MAQTQKTKAALMEECAELKQRLAALEEKDRFIRCAYDLARIGVWEYDVSADRTSCSDGTYKIFEYKPEQTNLNPGAFLDRVHPDDRERVQAFLGDAAGKKNATGEIDYRLRLPSGAEPVVHSNINFTYDENGNLINMLGTTQDVTEAKRAEEFLRRSEENFRSLMMNNPVAIAVTNRDGQCMTANPAMVKIFGYDDEEDFKRVPVYLHYHDIEDRKQLYAALERDGMVRDFPVTAKRKDGTLYYGALTSVYIKTKSGGYEMLTMFVDITERKRHEAELKQTIEFLNEAQTMAHMGSFDWDLVTNVITGSDEAYRIFGYNKDELTVTYPVFLDSVHTNDKDCVVKSLESAILNKKSFDMEYRIIRTDGEERTIHGRGAVAYGHEDKPVRMYGTVQDITERKRLDAELLRAQKLETIGGLAGGIAHDFNNLLLGIIGNVSLAKNFVRPDDKVFSFLNNIEKTAMRTKDLTRQLLTFSKGGEPIREAAPVNQLVKDCAALVLRGSNIECKYDFPEDLHNVDIDEGQISQVFNNIILNARHAMLGNGGRVINITARNVRLAETNGVPLRDGDYVRITVKDSGPGIAPNIIHKIFDPFFTTQERASGLGLAISYSIIKKHGGHVCVESREGRGASFDVYLPAVTVANAGRAIQSVVETGPAGSGKVLVMDDEEVVRDVSGEMLKLLGYDADFATDGGQAVEMYRKAWDAGAPYAAVIMDLSVPGAMGGKDAIGKLLEIDPGVKTIVSSGYSKDPIMSDFKKYGFTDVIAKPYRVSEFSRIVKGVITGKS
ncbi:MAG: PAS domain-containing protein [Deltaproteobacteria bacterium]|nr:PAS domain-containing protein [Deltaproteobacteria bacterium]